MPIFAETEAIKEYKELLYVLLLKNKIHIKEVHWVSQSQGRSVQDRGKEMGWDIHRHL